MSTRVFLIRHAEVEPIGKWLAGRMRGIHLNEKGEMQARRVARMLESTELQAIYSSPLERAQETAQIVARSKDLGVLTCDALTDIDFGEWTGKTFDVLDTIPEWHRFNSDRACARIPGGETMLDVTRRMADAIDSICGRHEGDVAVFSHCDPIRAAIAHYAGMPLDSILRLCIDPASISAIEMNSCAARVLALNVGGGSARSLEGGAG